MERGRYTVSEIEKGTTESEGENEDTTQTHTQVDQMEVDSKRQLLVYCSHEPRVRFVDLVRALDSVTGETKGVGGKEGGRKRRGKKKTRGRSLKKVCERVCVIVCACVCARMCLCMHGRVFVHT